MWVPWSYGKVGLGLNLNAPNEIFMTSISHTSTSFPQPRKIRILLQLSILLLFHAGEGGGGMEKGIWIISGWNQGQIWDIWRWAKIKTILEMSNCQSWSRLIISTTKFPSAIWSITQVSTRFERWRVLHNFFGRAREKDIFCILRGLHFCILNCSLEAS